MLPKLTTYAKTQLESLNPEGRTSLLEDFALSCEVNQNKPAFSCLDKNITFTELDALSRDFAAYLLGEGGLKPGDRLLIQLPNCLQYPIAAWGALRAGIVIVNTNPLYTSRELKHQLSDSGAKGMVILSDLLVLHKQVIEEASLTVVIASQMFDLHNQPVPWMPILSTTKKFTDVLALGRTVNLPSIEINMESQALLQYTGGTTGAAKGAILCHGNLFAAIRQADGNALEGSNELIVAPLPIYHIFGFAVYMLAGVLQGGLSILIPDPRDTDYLVKIMQSYPFTGFAAVNTMFISLMDHAEFDTIDFSNLKTVIAGGAALVEEVAREWLHRTGNTIQEGYGLSETASVLCCNGTNGYRPGTVGRPLIGQEIRVVDGEGNAVANGVAGELIVRGPQVMMGYWNQVQASAEVLDADGWFRTGDVAVLDDDGFVRIVDRIKDMILVSGFNVYPNEIESALYEHPDVQECAVIGVPSESAGELVKAFVVRRNETLNAEELVSHCRQILTGYKLPRVIEFCEELPKSNVGKILRRELRE